MLNKFLVLSFFILLPFPAFSSEFLNVFSGFAIALISGISLPVLFLSFFMRKTIALRWPFIILVSLCGLALLTFLQSKSLQSTQVSASLAVIYMLLVSLWPFYNNVRTKHETKVNIQSKQRVTPDALDNSLSSNPVYSTHALGFFYRRNTIIKLVTAILVITATLYLSLVWLYSHFGLANGWASTSIVYLIVNAICLFKLTDKAQQKFKLGLLGLYVSLMLFCLFTFLWLSDNTGQFGVVLTTLLSLLCSLIVGGWPLVAQIMVALKKEQKSIRNNKTQLSIDDIFQITHDPATNLPNAQQAHKYFELNSRRFPGHQFAAITFKPINFKQVNDVLGFHNSDILLLQMAYRIQIALIEDESLLRFDECSEPVRLVRLQSLQFMVICDLGQASHYAGSENKQESVKDQISRLCHRISSSVPEAMSFKSLSLNFELAFGVSITTATSFNVSETIAHATDALLLAEKSNRKVQYFDASSMRENERRLVDIERLRKDIINQNLYCFLQPQVHCKNGDLVGFELLLHWYKWLNEPLELTEFIELAEYSGELHTLVKHMFTQAISSIATLQRLHHHCTVSVKLSSKMLLEVDLIEFIIQQIVEQKITASYLVVELTEDVILSSSMKAKSTIDQLAAMGIKIAIADFSGSYEALRYLRKSSIDQIKINCKELIAGDEERADRMIVDALVNLCKGMKIPVIGSQMEKQVSLEIFRAMGGTIIQGNIIDAGVVPDEIEVWLKQQMG